MANVNRNFGGQVQFAPNAFSSSGTRTNLSLTSAYVHGTSGAGIAVRYFAQSTATIDELYVFLDLTTGTRANVTMACNIYNEHATSATQPGATLRATATATAYPAADDQWIKFTFGTPYTPTLGEVLWLVFNNTAAAPATDYPQIMSQTITLVIGSNNRGVGYSTGNGFSTAGTIQSEMPFVIKQGSNYFGNPLTQQAVLFASSALKRGIVFTPEFDVYIGTVEFVGSTLFTGIQVFDVTAGGVGPASTPLYSLALGTDANQSRDELIGSKTFSPLLFYKDKTYYVVLTVASATTAVSGGQVEDYASYPTAFDAFVDGMSTCASVIDNGAGGWTVDKGKYPAVRLIPTSFPPRTVGSVF